MASFLSYTQGLLSTAIDRHIQMIIVAARERHVGRSEHQGNIDFVRARLKTSGLPDFDAGRIENIPEFCVSRRQLIYRKFFVVDAKANVLIVNPLAVHPDLNAFAFKVRLVLTAMGPLTSGSLSVGSIPLVV